jgi:hypothetical protein
MKINDIKQYFNKIPKDQLIDELSSIIMKNIFLKDKYFLLINLGNKKQITDYVKNIINLEFSAPPEESLNFERIENLVKEIPDDLIQIDLYLFSIEKAMNFIMNYGDPGEFFYDKLELFFKNASQLIKNNDQKSEHLIKLKNLIKSTYHLGYGLYPTVVEFYENIFKTKF